MDDIWPEIPPSKKRAAYYLAGQAVVVLRESLELVRIMMDDKDDGSSWIEVLQPDLSKSRLHRSVRARSDAKAVIRAWLAGPATQLRYIFGKYPSDCPLPDFSLADSYMIESKAVWRAISLAGKISRDSPSVIRSSWLRVSHLVQGDEIWPAVEAVAKALLINGELAGCEVCDIARYAMRGKDKGAWDIQA